ncbi:hypothetical protein [Kribbella sp. VKM Ac-2566]|uniref:hypothetical protein n=1 Tax=Kribbella sp. VKM Ac-2566 TaxID=2512218 RepID=UPI001063F93A|nr:hypothetical protein [Kribbella sp. VKM Ac-2566]TDW88788.1 hypothetical protein EV647_5798 [Kribbella sp. VKM Ac-2566]
MTTLAQSPQNAPALSKPNGVDRLRTAAAEASQVRALSTHPDVVALRVESVRTQVDRCMWVGIVLGLAFTMVNVQAFAAQGAVLWSLPWFAAWLLDPMVSLVLIAVLRAEQITARYQVSDNTNWIRKTKRFAFAATYVMNTWASFGHRDIAGIVLHSVPPLLVFCAAETAPVLRDRLTEAVLRAEQTAALAAPEGASHRLDTTPATAELPTSAETTQTAAEAIKTAPAAPGKPKPSQTRRKPTKPSRTGRKLLADYVTEALAAVEPGAAADAITPAWARHTTGCSTGLSAKVAAAVRDELTTAPHTSTDDMDAPGETARVAA